MIVSHVKPESWVDTGEAGKIQPSEVAGLAHVVSLSPEDVELLRGPQGFPGADGAPGPQGPQGVSGESALSAQASIVVNSASAALSITQTGTGDALVIEDSESVDTSPVVVDANGKLIVGAAAAMGSAPLQVFDTGFGGSMVVNRFSNDSAPSRAYFVKYRGGVVEPMSAINGDAVTRHTFSAYDGAGVVPLAQVDAVIDGDVVQGGGSIKGRLSFFTGSGSYLVERLRIDSSGLITARNSAGLGYGFGSGGAVTQMTSKRTGVSLNKASGQITLNNEALAAGESALITVSNTMMTAADLVVAHLVSSGVVDSAAYRVDVVRSGAGSFRLRITNISAGSLSEAAVINFAIIKGSAS